MRLRAGQVAPYFKRTDIGGNVVTLTDYANKKLLLCFFRYAGCPWCNLAIHRLTVAYPELEKRGVSVVAFIQSPDSLIREYIINRHAPLPAFPLIADPNREVYDLYGVEDSRSATLRSLADAPDWIEATAAKGYRQGRADGSLSLVPAQFLIGPHRLKITTARYGTSYGDDMSLDEMYAFADMDPASL